MLIKFAYLVQCKREFNDLFYLTNICSEVTASRDLSHCLPKTAITVLWGWFSRQPNQTGFFLCRRVFIVNICIVNAWINSISQPSRLFLTRQPRVNMRHVDFVQPIHIPRLNLASGFLVPLCNVRKKLCVYI